MAASAALLHPSRLMLLVFLSPRERVLMVWPPFTWAAGRMSVLLSSESELSGGDEIVRFAPRDYHRHIAEHVEPWTYIKFPYLRDRGWRGFVEGNDTSPM